MAYVAELGYIFKANLHSREQYPAKKHTELFTVPA